MSYRGNSESTEPKKWIDEETPMFSTLCYVEADTTKLCATLKPQFGLGRRTKFYEIKYDVVLTLGLTELKAHISWEDKYGIKKRSPAIIVYQ